MSMSMGTVSLLVLMGLIMTGSGFNHAWLDEEGEAAGMVYSRG